MLFRSVYLRSCVFGCLVAACGLACGDLHAQGPIVPSQLGTSPLVANDTVPSNTLNYGFNVVNSFDDNAPSTNPATRQTNFTYSIQPRASLSIDRSRWTSTLFYGPSFTYSSDISTYNNTAQAAGGDFRYNFTPRLSLDFRNSFSSASSPIESYQASTELPTLGVLNQPSALLLGANARSTTYQSQADLVYRLDQHTSVGAGGSFNELKYSTVTASSSTGNAFQDTRGWSAYAFYSHQLSPRYSVGAQYTAHNVLSSVDLGQFSSLSHQALGFFNISFNPSISLSIFAGPEISNLDYNFVAFPTLSSSRNSSFAGGSTLTWHGEHNGMTASFIQQVGGAGLSGEGAVSVRTVSLQLEHRLSKRSSLGFTGNYTTNNQLVPTNLLTLADSASAGINFSRSISQRLTLQVSALRQQFMGNALPGFGLRSHDIASVSLSYSWARPIGR